MVALPVRALLLHCPLQKILLSFAVADLDSIINNAVAG